MPVVRCSLWGTDIGAGADGSGGYEGLGYIGVDNRAGTSCERFAFAEGLKLRLGVFGVIRLLF